MQSTNRVNGKRKELNLIFESLRKVHDTKWPSLLRKHDSAYDSNTGNNTWENAKRGKVGLETLRQLIADMQAIVTNQRAKTTLQRQGLTRRAKV